MAAMATGALSMMRLMIIAARPSARHLVSGHACHLPGQCSSRGSSALDGVDLHGCFFISLFLIPAVGALRCADINDVLSAPHGPIVHSD
jgi:hypothetical protein